MSYGSVTKRASAADPGSQAVRAELERIVASPLFEDADRLVRFLTFVVEEALAGRGSALKESLVGVEVFGRSPGYDPKTDPIVRVQARRLRSKLESWYAAGGQSSTVRISLPKGGYLPEFGAPPKPGPADAGAAPRSRRTTWIWILTGAVVALFAALFMTTRPGAKPSTSGSRLFTAYPGYQTRPAFSPDGRTLAFYWDGPDSDNMDVYVHLSTPTPRAV